MSFCASEAMLCTPYCHSKRSLIVILNEVKNLSAFPSFGERWIDRKVKTDEGANSSKPLITATRSFSQGRSLSRSLVSLRMTNFVILRRGEAMLCTLHCHSERSLIVILNEVKNLSAFPPFGGRWIDRKVKTDEGQIHQNPSSPLRGASPKGEAFQDHLFHSA